MEIGAEISLYPLASDYAPGIKAFLERLRAADGLKVVTTSLSTQVFGDYDQVVATLAREMRSAFAGAPGSAGKAVFILKLFGPLSPPPG